MILSCPFHFPRKVWFAKTKSLWELWHNNVQENAGRHGVFTPCRIDESAPSLSHFQVGSSHEISENYTQPRAPSVFPQIETKGFPSGGKEHPSRGCARRKVRMGMTIIHKPKTDARRGRRLAFANHGACKSSGWNLVSCPAPPSRAGSRSNASKLIQCEPGMAVQPQSRCHRLPRLLRPGQRKLYEQRLGWQSSGKHGYGPGERRHLFLRHHHRRRGRTGKPFLEPDHFCAGSSNRRIRAASKNQFVLTLSA